MEEEVLGLRAGVDMAWLKGLSRLTGGPADLRLGVIGREVDFAPQTPVRHASRSFRDLRSISNRIGLCGRLQDISQPHGKQRRRTKEQAR